jgi:NAD(P)-dependent dehydrogenase (short-subunit alcohol dehydrogenase family)
VVQVDVAQPEQLEHLLAQIRETMPPLRGVIHAAGVVDDGPLAQQSWERFERVLAPPPPTPFWMRWPMTAARADCPR